MKNQIKILCGAVALVMAGQVSADTTWTLVGASPSSGVSVAAYANTDGTGAESGQKLEMGYWSGQTNQGGGQYYGGITNHDSASMYGCSTGCDSNEGGSPEHAIDNQERHDMVLLSFTSQVKLNGMDISWKYPTGDTDMTVLAFTGTGDSTLTGKTYGQLITNGWKLIDNGSYADVAVGSRKSINAEGFFSSLWLIGAYNPLAALKTSKASGTFGSLSDGNDYVKLSSVTGTVSPLGKVPEPGSLVLFGLGLLGMIGLRRRQPVRF